MIRKPIWNTMAYGVDERNNLDHEAVQLLTSDLLLNDLPVSQILIDPRWEQHGGDDVFNSEFFPDPSTLFTWLKNGPAKATPVLMVHPFAAVESSAYRNAMADSSLGRFFVRNGAGAFAKAKWWMGEGAMMDFTEHNAVRFKESRVKALMELYGLSGIFCFFLS